MFPLNKMSEECVDRVQGRMCGSGSGFCRVVRRRTGCDDDFYNDAHAT